MFEGINLEVGMMMQFCPHIRLSFSTLLLGISLTATFTPMVASAGEVRARAAHRFVNAIGVNTHFGWNQSAYVRQYAQAKAALDELGVRHIRDEIGANDGLSRIRDLNAAMGVRLTGLIDQRTGGRLVPGRIQSQVDAARTQLGTRIVTAIEGPNEYNLLERDGGYLGWVSELRAYQSQLYTAVKRDPVLRAVPVVAPSMAGPNDIQYFQKLGNLTGSIDVGNTHAYSNWRSFEQYIGQATDSASLAAPQQPIWATETGWHQAINSGKQWVSDAAIVKYAGRLMATTARYAGLGKAFFYQLIDPYDDPSKSHTNMNFGLLDFSLRREPAFYAVRNTMHVMCDGPLTFSPQTLRYSLTGNLSNVRAHLYQKRNRSFYLVIWLEVQSFQSGRDIYNPPQAVSLRFEQGIAQARIYEPSAVAGGIANSNRPKRTFARPTSIALNVADALTIVEITPTGTAIPPVSTRCNFAAS